MLDFFAGVPGKLKTLTDRLTSVRAALLDNLDAAISTRAPASTALSNVLWTSDMAAALAGGLGNSKCQEYVAAVGSFTFTVPDNVSLVWVTLQAPGQCGGKNAAGGGGGGAGELLLREPYAVTPGGTVAGSVGTGSATAAAKTTTFGTLSVTSGTGSTTSTLGRAGGGVLGAPAQGASPGIKGSEQGGVIGGASGGDGNGAPQTGGPCGRFAGGAVANTNGGGGASYFAAGGAANDSTTPTKPGIGAGGGGTRTGASNSEGGDGYVKVEWVG